MIALLSVYWKIINLCTMNGNATIGMFILSDPPEVGIEEVWVPHKTTFEERLICHIMVPHILQARLFT